MAFISTTEKPHAVFIPFPSQGHINPLLKLAKLLHRKGFHITFVNTEYNKNRLLQSKGLDALDGLPDCRFETIPDGLPPSHSDATQDLASLADSTRKSCLVPFRNLLAKLNDTQASEVPPVACIITDGVMSFTLEVSEELGIPNVFFWTTAACGFMGFKLCVDLMNRGITPFKDASYLTDGCLDAMVDWVPGLKNMRLKDVPSFIQTTDPTDRLLYCTKEDIERTLKASDVILHSFDVLERDTLDALSSMFPPIYEIGPLQLLVNQISDECLTSINCNLWKEEDECIQWLDSKEPASVVYVNFGSVVVMEPHQILELAWGFANSKQNFLWIIRPDLITGSSAILPSDFIAEIKDRGLMVKWCAQEQVLNHPSVGGFITHSGWNSTIESITAGVPMLSLPFFSEQLTNCKYVTTEWGIGLEIDRNTERNEIEKLVRELIVGENGKKMKKKAMEWKARALEATSPGGSSFLNLEKLVKEVLLPGKQEGEITNFYS